MSFKIVRHRRPFMGLNFRKRIAGIGGYGGAGGVGGAGGSIMSNGGATIMSNYSGFMPMETLVI